MLTDKHAYLIIAHHQFDLLEMLIKLLDYEMHDIYLHVDCKASEFDAEYFANITKYSKIYFLERKNVVWGGYSQIDIELDLLKKATDGQYAYYHLLSGVDLPLKNAKEIYNFFEGNRGKEFVHFSEQGFIRSQPVQERARLYHIFQENAGREKNIYHHMQILALKVQRILKIDRLKNQKIEISAGANWFSITHELAVYLLAQESFVKKLFHNGKCVDELFLQTVVANSEFIEKVYYSNLDKDKERAMRYIDWQRGTPYVFTEQDFDELIHSGCMFARKFDIVLHRKLCEQIFEYITQSA